MQRIQFADPDGLLEYWGEIIINNRDDVDVAGRFEPTKQSILKTKVI